jgi:hypothetical protein
MQNDLVRCPNLANSLESDLIIHQLLDLSDPDRLVRPHSDLSDNLTMPTHWSPIGLSGDTQTYLTKPGLVRFTTRTILVEY